MTGKQLRTSILQEAIAGRLVPQNSSDEPASDLLKSIREEKARLVKEGKLPKDKNETLIFRGDDKKFYEQKGKTVTCIDDQIPFEIPDSWEWERWGNISLSIQYGYNAPALPTGDIKMVRISDIHDNKVSWESVPYCKISQKEIENYLLKPNDILFARTGGTIGKSYLVTSVPEKAVYAGYLIRTQYSNLLSPVYMKSFMESSLYWEQLREGTIATAQPNCNGKRLSRMLIPLPPLAEQKRIVAKIEELMPLVDEYEKAQEEFDNLNAGLKGKLHASLLQEAIAGRLVPQDPNDEPASELLKKIRKEKEKLIKEGKLPKDKNETLIFRGDDKKFYEQKGKTVTCIDDQIPFEIPDSWAWCRLGNIGDWGAGATPYKSEPKYYGGDILWLRTGELNNGVVYDTEIKITEKALKECSLRMAKEGDVLVAMYCGPTIGNVAIAGKEMTTNQACCACTPLGIYNYYLFYFLMASKADLAGKGAGGVQSNISKKKLVNHLIPLPPLAEQKRIVEKLESLFAVLDNLDTLTA